MACRVVLLSWNFFQGQQGCRHCGMVAGEPVFLYFLYHWAYCCKDHAKEFPTLAWIALDFLAIPASSVPCEWLFSAGKLIAVDRHACLGDTLFEELQIMKHAWRPSIQNHAALNSQEIEEFDMSIFQAMLDDDAWAAEFDDELDTIDLF